jgi:hypothetical protein
MHEFAVDHDPVRQPRLPAALVIAGRQGVNVREVHHRPSLSEQTGYTAQSGYRAII